MTPYQYYIQLRNSAEDDPIKRDALNALADSVLNWIGQHTNAPDTPLPDVLMQRVIAALSD